MSKTSHQGPAETLRDGFVKVTIWSNEGEKGPFFTATVAKTYEKDGKYYDGHSFNASDLLVIAELARLAYQDIRERRAALSREAQEAPEPKV
ncbi:hypothetical protein HNR46_003960 [Haloferula luteola]|uniref:Uncharacterized protein n=1 Tax=Haloferula luteola TaxID=595692 RepID=A0A840VIT6_9BACT|nr:hypothetical protein [Haloferula luteola]MBB5353699.1 hypothetical protein [Haloferula luteola]